MTAVGLYGVMAYAVSQRTHEIGIRMALGAHRRSVLRLVIGEGMAQAVIGSAAGLVIALGITHSMASLLFGTSPTDRATFVGVTLVLGLVALAACLIPALRATRIEPAMALRCE